MNTTPYILVYRYINQTRITYWHIYKSVGHKQLIFIISAETVECMPQHFDCNTQASGCGTKALMHCATAAVKGVGVERKISVVHFLTKQENKHIQTKHEQEGHYDLMFHYLRSEFHYSINDRYMIQRYTNGNLLILGQCFVCRVYWQKVKHIVERIYFSFFHSLYRTDTRYQSRLKVHLIV